MDNFFPINRNTSGVARIPTYIKRNVPIPNLKNNAGNPTTVKALNAVLNTEKKIKFLFKYPFAVKYSLALGFLLYVLIDTYTPIKIDIVIAIHSGCSKNIFYQFHFLLV